MSAPSHFAMPLDMTSDLRTFVDAAVEALAAGRTVAIGSVTVRRGAGNVTAYRGDKYESPFAVWSIANGGDRRVLAEAIFEALRVAP